MRGCVLPVPHSTAVSKGEEMNVFLFSYYFCPDSNISWPTLDTDLSRHFSFVPLPLFQFPNPYFALQSVAGRLLLCAQKPQECGRVTDHTPHTCWYFYEIGSVIFNPTCQQRKMTSSVVTILKIPCPFPRESEENCSCLWGKTKIQMSMCCSEMKLGGQSHCPQTQKPKVFIWQLSLILTVLLIWDWEWHMANVRELMVAGSAHLILIWDLYPWAVALGDMSGLNCVFWDFSIYIINNSSN